MTVNPIITKGYGEQAGTLIPTTGFGLIVPEIIIIEKEFVVMELCPWCELSVRNNIMFIRDPDTREKTFYCRHCEHEIEWDGRRWQKVKQWFEE